MSLKATAVWHPDAPRDLANRFRLPGVSLSHRNEVWEGRDAALVFGGDGTVHLHLQELVAAGMPVLVVPVGSGNDFAHALGIRSVEDALRAWRKFKETGSNVRAIDLGVIAGANSENRPRVRQHRPKQNPPVTEDETLFCCVGGLGLDADANRHANKMPRWMRRRGGYLLAAALAILGKQRTRIRAQASSPVGEPLLDADEQAELMVFANAPAYGDGLLIAPGAKLDDGKLDLVYARRMSRLRLLRIAPMVLRGTHIGMPEVWFARAAEVRVESDPPRMIYADGEPICQTPVVVRVVPRALKVICG